MKRSELNYKMNNRFKFPGGDSFLYSQRKK
jgi:hypothetical protein